jgi:Flp pilus assembly protein TadD
MEFVVEDRAGRPLFRSGALGPEGAPDPDAHRFGLVALDREGHRITPGALHRMVTPLYNHAIAPGEAEVVRYRFRVPAGTRGPLRIRARLKERAFSAAFHRAVFADQPGVPLPAPRVVAEAEGYLLEGKDPALASRSYDYGIGLFLQGDLPAAAAAMRRVQELAPNEVAGFLGLGRVYLQEGELLAARSQFELARATPGAARDGDARPEAFLATVYRRMGDYDRALSLLEPLADRYPRDRQLFFEIGITHFRSGRNEEAADAFRRMLDVDPDDVSGHYNLMLCLQRLNRLPEARREETIYRYLKEDDTVRQLVGRYLTSHPADNHEFQTIHEHVL